MCVEIHELYYLLAGSIEKENGTRTRGKNHTDIYYFKQQKVFPGKDSNDIRIYTTYAAVKVKLDQKIRLEQSLNLYQAHAIFY